MLDDMTLAEAGQSLFGWFYYDAYEAAGGHFPPASQLDDYVPDVDEERLLPPMKRVFAALEERWGRSTESIFEEMEIDEEDWSKLAYYICMSVVGHGVGHDVFLYEEYPDVTPPVDLSPFNDEICEYYELAEEVVQKELAAVGGEGDIPNGEPVSFRNHLSSGEDLFGIGRTAGYASPDYVIRAEKCWYAGNHETSRDLVLANERDVEPRTTVQEVAP